MRSHIITYFDFLGQSIGAEFYLVGGAVRDPLIGSPVKDFDMVARGLPVTDLMEGLSHYGSVELIGERFEVVSFRPTSLGTGYEIHPGPYEIALPRTEVSTGKGTKGFKANVDPELSVEEDLRRRDFTINSMAINVHTRERLDPYNGAYDIENRLIRILHSNSFRDDPLRILRMLRFVAKYNFLPTADTVKAAMDAAHLLGDREEVPGERIKDELVKLIVAPNADEALRLARSMDLLRHFLPELAAAVGCTQNRHHDFDVFEHTVRVLKNTESDDWQVKMAALFHDIGKPPTKWTGVSTGPHFYLNDGKGSLNGAQEYAPGGEPRIAGNHETVGADITRHRLRELKFSNDQIDRIAGLVAEHMFARGPKLSGRTARRLLARLNRLPGSLEENVEALFALRYGDNRGGKVKFSISGDAEDRRFHDIVLRELERSTAMSVKDLDINGHTLMGLGFEGVRIGQVQIDMLEWVMDNPDRNEVSQLIDFAKGRLVGMGIEGESNE